MSQTIITRRKFVEGIGAFGVGAVVAAPPVLAQGRFPTRPIHWVSIQAAGGAMDLTMRALQPYLAAQGVNTTIDYVLGGGGNVARAQLYASNPDGYTLNMETLPSLYLGELSAEGTFKAADMEPIYGWDIDGWQLCVKKDSPIRSYKDLLELSQKRPVTIASIGRGGASHLQLLVLAKSTGLRMNIVHYSGTAQAYPQVIGGNVDAAIGGPSSAARAADQLHFLFVFRETGEPALPGVPTLKSQGFDVPEINQVWYTYTAPKVPEERLVRLEQAFRDALAAPGAKDAQIKTGFLELNMLSRADLKRRSAESGELAIKYREDLLR